jgi:hypothetical protein
MNLLQKAQSISGISVVDLPSFTQNDADTMLNFAIHRRQNKTQNKKSLV